MKKSFGEIFYNLRKAKGLTQEEIAQKLNVSAQAVSKWENDLTYPDVSLLLDIANLLDTTVDNLLGKEEKQTVKMLNQDEKKDLNLMMLKIVVNSSKGDKVRINLPLSLLKVALDSGIDLSTLSTNNETLKSIDLAQIVHLVEKGVIGKIVEVNSADGDVVEIFVE